MTFGILTYANTDNLGDEIQSLAALRLIPKPQYFFNRDNLGEEGDRVETYASVVMNGWFGQNPEKWPPSDKIRPLLVSMHVTREKVASKAGVRAHEFMLSPPLRKYLQVHGPVGARDLDTLRLLQEADIPAYFSGCLTLTLERPDVDRCEDMIVLADAPLSIMDDLRSITRKPLFRTSHVGDPLKTQAERMFRAQELLDLYARASCVVTARLHCALPCLAMGTPVLFVNLASDGYRFAGLLDLLHHTTMSEVRAGKLRYDISAPPPNKTLHLPYREALLARVAEFVKGDEGFQHHPNSLHPTQADKDEAIRLIRASRPAA
jgi:hypothetical protein